MPLADLYKTQIRQFARYLKIPKSIIMKPPSPGFFRGQTDEEELGCDYETIDLIFLGWENWGSVITGDLAESWETSEDGKEWTFYLRKDVKWHDGQPFTADDVLFTFQAIQNPDVQTGGFHDRFMEGEEPIQFEKVDDYTVKAILKEPIAPFVTNITVPIIAIHEYRET